MLLLEIGSILYLHWGTGAEVDRDRHVIQDAAELYSVYRMQRTAEELGRAMTTESSQRYDEFVAYLEGAGLDLGEFEGGPYAQYKTNADLQLPDFVVRIAEHWPSSRFKFTNVEKEYRDLGLKGDFLLAGSDPIASTSVSLKNYIGSGGITRPQVGSGTYASFAQGFVFERVGVGMYLDPGTGQPFKGSNVSARDSALASMGLSRLTPLFAELDACQASVREEFLGPDCEFYDKVKVEAAARRVAERGIEVTLALFSAIGLETIKSIVLARSGLDGKEEALYFDRVRHIDSITNRTYHQLRNALNDDATMLSVSKHGQGIRFEFRRDDEDLLDIHVPYTINTNGAWFRPSEEYEGTRQYNDKGHLVDLCWGQRRPYKSKEIATSTNMYVNLAATGIFDTH